MFVCCFDVLIIVQQKIADEVENMAKNKFAGSKNLKVPFKLVWLTKSRHVCGEPGNLAKMGD